MTASPSSSPEEQAVPSGGCVRGRLSLPPSKSVTHRYLNLALLAAVPVEVERPLYAEDTRLFLEALRRLGYKVDESSQRVGLTPPPQLVAGSEIFCGNAGTLFRFLVGSLATVPGKWRLDGSERLRQRPVGPLVEALRDLGAEIECRRRPGYLPLVVAGGSFEGGRTSLDAGQSSQFLSALLMAALRGRRPTLIEVISLASSPYADLTVEAIGAFQGRVERTGPSLYRVLPSPLRPGRLRVEGDFSAACYPAAAAALTGGRVELEPLGSASRQGDRGFFDLLRRMGAQVTWQGGERVEVSGGSLAAVEADLSAMPDQVPTLAALAPFARGTTRVYNVAHLRIKESDRLRAMAGELQRLGATVEERTDGLLIPGVWAEARPPTEAVVVDSHQDHRIAMSLALVGLRRPGVRVAHPRVVGKSYPEFWGDLNRLLMT